MDHLSYTKFDSESKMKFFAILFAFFALVAVALAHPGGVGAAIAGNAAGTVAGLGGAVIGKCHYAISRRVLLVFTSSACHFALGGAGGILGGGIDGGIRGVQTGGARGVQLGQDIAAQN